MSRNIYSSVSRGGTMTGLITVVGIIASNATGAAYHLYTLASRTRVCTAYYTGSDIIVVCNIHVCTFIQRFGI